MVEVKAAGDQALGVDFIVSSEGWLVLMVLSGEMIRTKDGDKSNV